MGHDVNLYQGHTFLFARAHPRETERETKKRKTKRPRLFLVFLSPLLSISTFSPTSLSTILFTSATVVVVGSRSRKTHVFPRHFDLGSRIWNRVKPLCSSLFGSGKSFTRSTMLFVVVVVVVVSSVVVVVVISNVKEAVVRARSTKAMITDEYFLNAKSRKKNCRVREKKRSYFFVRRKPTPKRPKVFYLGFLVF